MNDDDEDGRELTPGQVAYHDQELKYYQDLVEELAGHYHADVAEHGTTHAMTCLIGGVLGLDSIERIVDVLIASVTLYAGRDDMGALEAEYSSRCVALKMLKED